jgi:predicted AAA+ superfamily ATPase
LQKLFNMNSNIELLKKYNFWGDSSIELGYIRNDYLDKLFQFTGNKLIKVLTGQRRAGKSFILRQLANRLITNGTDKRNIFMLNMEFADFDFVKNYHDLDSLFKQYLTELNPKGKVYIFLDEIQNVEGWEKLINSYAQDYTEDYEVFITGSNSHMLSGELATLLSGRYVVLEILPFSYGEFLGISSKSVSRQSYIDYMESGGVPELFHLPVGEIRRSFISSLKDTVLLRDIVQRFDIKDSRLLEDLLVFVLNNSSNLLSINNITNYLRSQGRTVSFNTVSNYLEYLKNSFLIHSVERYNLKGKSLLSRVCKYYANDLSFKNYLYGGFGFGIGYKLENLVYLDLRRAGFEIYTGVFGKKEVDFIAIKSDKKIYVQVAYTLADEATAKREYAPLEALSDAYARLIVTMDDFSVPVHNGIVNVQAWNFAETLNKL